MSVKRRPPHHPKIKNSSVKVAQRGGSSTVVLLFVLLIVLGGAVFLFSQMSKFKSGRSVGLVIEPTPGAVAQPEVMTPTTARKKGILGGLFDKKELTPTPTVEVKPTAVPTPTPIIRALPKGLLNFTISQGKDMVGPLFLKGSVSDFSAARDTKQTVTLSFDKTRAPQSVTGSLKTDTKSTPILFTKSADSQGSEVWVGEWTLLDTNNVNMAMSFEAINQTGKSTAGVAIR